MVSNEMVTIIIDETTLAKIKSDFSQYQVENKGEYIIFFAQKNGLNLTIFRNKDAGKYKAFFSGINSLEEARVYDPNCQVIEQKKKKEPTKQNWLDLGLQIGSDEVGTGDFFGPIIVCAALVKREDIVYLRGLEVDDSKRLSDAKIERIVPILLTKKIPYAHVSISPEKYNQIIFKKGYNMNVVKTILHNKVLTTLTEKYPDVKHIYVDQFCDPSKYFEYLSNTSNPVTKITFKTKGETYYPSVAVGSLIARYSFIKKMKEIGQEYGVTIPYGASDKVDEFAYQFAKKHGIDELKKICKANFTNLQTVIDRLENEKVED